MSITRSVTIVLFLALACRSPVDTSWHEEAGHRWRALDVGRRGTAGFTLVDESHTGVTFANAISDSALVRNRILAQGAGTCLGDVDGDQLVDVYLARTEGANALYLNRGGWRFDEVAEGSGVAAADRYSSGCTFADVDGDRDLDLLLVALGGPNALFLNDGTGRFDEQTEDSDLASAAGSVGLAVADVDGDGWLDVYVVNYKAYTALDRIPPRGRSFDAVVRRLGPRRYEVREEYRAEYKLVERDDLGGISLAQRADPDAFYRNAGAGRFVREPLAGNPRFADEQGRPLEEEADDFGLAAMFADLDGDGAPDLYVANDFEDPDQLWMNDGKGNFRLAPWFALRSTSNSTMAVDIGDVNRDGRPDLFQVDMLSRDTRRLRTQIPTHTSAPRVPGLGRERLQMQRNTLHLNRGDGTFAEVARLAGASASGWSWSTAFLDVDLDGWEDLLIGTGHLWDVMDGDTQHRLRGRLEEIDWRRMLFEFPPLPLPNVALRNAGDLTFEDASRSWRFDIGEDMSHGMALGDLDGDGDQDVVINRMRAPAALLRNDVTAPRLAIRLRGVAPNTAGIGSTVRVIGGAVPRQEREIVAGGLYLSGSDAMLTFATGDAAEVTIEVDWRDGDHSVITGARPNRLYEIDQSGARRESTTPEAAPPPLFIDVSAQLDGHRHVEPWFDDFARQLLLPGSFSQLGPGVAWDDVDGDGREDLLVGAGRTGRLAWFRNGGRHLRAAEWGVAPAHVDLTTILGLPDGAGGRAILAGISNYEMGSVRDALRVPSAVSYSVPSGALTELTPGDSASAGPLALADLDGDGDLDLFVGGRIVPGAYPLSPSSRLFRNVDGRFVADDANGSLLRTIGMVSAALFSDLDGNGWPDLLVAIEWGTIRVFLNERGRLRPAADLPGLAGTYSRWNGLATGDLDGDGRLDIVATSWGRNTELQASEARPLFLYTGYFAERGRPTILLARDDERLGGVVPLAPYSRIALSVPGVSQRIRTFRAFADATVDDVLGSAARSATRLGATTLDHMIFLNRGDRFEARPLPQDAQFAPAFHAGVADFDGDGNEDVVLSQNFFATNLEFARYDAGRGLLLLGDGRGALTAMGGERSGLAVYGEQRGAAHADFDGDGRLDLALSQNGAETRLFRNVGARPGLRVRLVGPSGNPTGVGALMRVRYGDREGPVREVQAGSGYWSQNGAVQVLGLAAEPRELWLRWPDRREQVVAIREGQREVTVRAP